MSELVLEVADLVKNFTIRTSIGVRVIRKVVQAVSGVNFTVGVGQPVKSLSDMRRARARSAQIGGPDLISHCLQVSTYSSEPVTSSRARNLLSKRDCRSALADELEEPRPEVSLVFFPKAFAGLAEWLARA